jgi:hypothetical protein
MNPRTDAFPLANSRLMAHHTSPFRLPSILFSRSAHTLLRRHRRRKKSLSPAASRPYQTIRGSAFDSGELKTQTKFNPKPLAGPDPPVPEKRQDLAKPKTAG